MEDNSNLGLYSILWTRSNSFWPVLPKTVLCFLVPVSLLCQVFFLGMLSYVSYFLRIFSIMCYRYLELPEIVTWTKWYYLKVFLKASLVTYDTLENNTSI